LTWPKPTIGISACLLGQKVRHNGEHKRHDWLNDTLGKHVSWVPLCPEVEMGLGVPRETMRLIGTAQNPQLITVQGKKDLTDLATQTVERILQKEFAWDSFIFKRDSPTCGMERVKVYGKGNIPIKSGVGLFSRRVQENYPRIPMIEEGRLSDLGQRELFLIRLFAWAKFKRLPRDTKSLQAYHQVHKLQFMAFHPQGYAKLGRFAANSTQLPADTVFENYELGLVGLLAGTLTAQKNINAYQHILGYFKNHLEAREKTHILDLFRQYRSQKLPLASLSTLFKFLIDKYSVEYLRDQTILEPYPESIIL
jgi:uncharacterized protein YbgA (DUF1722 family)/uncharacterized protein YbbK (DUF523 family)